MHKDGGSLNVRGMWKSLCEIQEKHLKVSLLQVLLSCRGECGQT